MMAKKTILLLLAMLLVFCFAGAAAAEGESSSDSGALSDSLDTAGLDSIGSTADTTSFDEGSLSEPASLPEILEGTEPAGNDCSLVQDNDAPAESGGLNEGTDLTITGGDENPDALNPDPPVQTNTEDLPSNEVLSAGEENEVSEGNSLNDFEDTGDHPHPDCEEASSSEQLFEGEAVEADPYFTSGGVTYSFFAGPGTDTPTELYNLTNPIQFAIDFIELNGTVPTDGKIYVEKATYTDNVTIDGLLPYLSGLKGLIGLADSSLEYPTVNGNIAISNLLSGFTLSGFNINGGVMFEFNTGQLNLTDLNVSNPTSTGIDIYDHKGNIVLTRVKSSNNNGQGAYLDNFAGGNVTVTNCAFDHNIGHPAIVDYGLQIVSSGTININGISSSGNGGDGLVIADGFARLTIKNAVFNNNKKTIDATTYGYGLRAYTSKNALITLDTVFTSDNGKDGIYLETYGSITAKNISTGWNSRNGMLIDTTGGTGKVNVSNGKFYGNGADGLAVTSRGAITLSSIQSWENQNKGAYLNNSTGSGNVIVTSPASAGHLGANTFERSVASNGLEIHSKGSVIVSNIYANENALIGLYINNSYGTGNVTINKNLPSWENSFWENVSHGIYVNTRGSVVINDSSAWNNHSDGIYVYDTSKSISIARGRFDHNEMHGLYLCSGGNVLLTDVRVNYNGSAGSYDGVFINNAAGTGSVTIKTSNRYAYHTFNKNTFNGIYITSRGAVSISTIEVVNNDWHGIEINNSSAPIARAVSITNSYFELNKQNGVKIISKGAVVLTDVNACGNGTASPFSGVSINNTSGTGSVTVKSSRPGDYYHFSDNSGHGISISSGGLVSISNAIASNNTGGEGLSISNQPALSPKAVNLSRCRLEYNSQSGIHISSKGTISLVDVSSSGNKEHGILINNSFGTGNVTIKSSRAGDYYQCSGNLNGGVHILSKGVVSVSNIEAADNGQAGMSIDNFNAPVPKAVSVTRVNLLENGREGIWIYSIGAVALTDVNSCGNGKSGTYNGVTITNDVGTGNVTIRSSRVIDYQHFSDNSGTGVRIVSSGIISVSNAIANGNNGHGMCLSNYGVTAAAPRSVSVSRSYFCGNKGDFGLVIDTIGHLTLDTVTASDNHNGYGAYLNAYRVDQVTAANVTVRGENSEFSSNITDGLTILTKGNITLQNVVADLNGWHGIWLRNQFAGSKGSVTISAAKNFWNSTSQNNSSSGIAGLYILTSGNVSVTNLRSAENKVNGQQGIEINNDTPGRTVALTNVDANNNKQTGIFIYNPGPVTITNPHAYSNKNHGISINNATNVTVRNTNLKEASWIGGNTNYGLSIVATGHILVSGSIYINDNGKDGLYIFNNGNPFSTVTVSGITADHNNWHNLNINSWGNIVLRNLIARDNDWDRSDLVRYEGVFLNNHAAGSGTGNISISGTNNFSNNSYSGVFALTNGTISISGVTAVGNGVHGVQASTYGSGKNVVLQNITASQNGDHGLRVLVHSPSTGTITLNSVKAFSNGLATNAHGVYIDSGLGNVYFNNCVFIGNYGSGIYARRTLSRLFFKNTLYFGNDADNSGDPDLEHD